MKKIFIIHGWTYTVNSWDECIAALRVGGFEPVMLSVPGLTESSEKVWTLEEYVAWLDQKLQGEQEIVLVGHSNGGRIAIAYAASHPGRVQKLVLIDSAGIVHNEPLLRLKRTIFGTVAKVGKTFTKSPLMRKIFYRLIGARDYERAPANMRETMKNLISIDLSDKLPLIDSKTLIIWGERDTATPVSDGRRMNQLIKGSKLIIIPEAGHSPHQTAPKRIVEEILAF